MKTESFFSLKLVYDTQDVLQYAALDGIPMCLSEERRKIKCL